MHPKQIGTLLLNNLHIIRLGDLVCTGDGIAILEQGLAFGGGSL